MPLQAGFRIPTPQELGMPEKFHDGLRALQEDMIYKWFNSDKRHKVFCAPTGIGKTLFYIYLARMTNTPTVILTSTRGLQKQVFREFESLGLLNIMGKSNYPCTMEDEWTCEDGAQARCPLVGSPACSHSVSSTIFFMRSNDPA